MVGFVLEALVLIVAGGWYAGLLVGAVLLAFGVALSIGVAIYGLYLIVTKPKASGNVDAFVILSGFLGIMGWVTWVVVESLMG